MPERSSRIAVVGAGLAALRAVESLLRSGLDCRIVVLGDEPHLPYSRPPLSKDLLSGDVGSASFRLPDSDHVRWRTATRVVGADLGARRLRLADDETVDYDGLVVATGVRARRLPLPGPEPLTLRTLDDAAVLRERAAGARTALVVGGGVLGCELASSLTDAGIAVQVVVGPDEIPMQPVLGASLAAELRRRHEERGTVFHTGSAVLGYSATGAWLSDGTEVRADLVVETVGSVPNTEWLAGNGLDLSGGLLCDDRLGVAGAPGVVGCGDVVRFPSQRYGGRRVRVEHWAHASESGRHAGRTLAAQLTGSPAPPPFDPLPTFWTDQLGVRIQGLGLPGLGTADHRVLDGQLSGDPVLGYHDRETLVGVVLLNRPEVVGSYRALL
ncbi:NAD(P)/FAD-dependent oxidoreductase [Nocardioides albidus]|uniref:NAD(P)/FAD-dependent oxidoreductase n=1 Tax=Nocardioides albidus TaxID=1517589 RepID=A0A5C4VS45_9ACTN|nr:FAD-dependent oxidoreductase [Nocardioides albidus]TNM38365.1 NAD(P)/FAD-dependent oxidoreductase [Nocardioides albidus]